MGTKRGQVRKTARRAYERKRKITLAAAFKRMTRNGRTKDEKRDDYFSLGRLFNGR